LLGYGAAVLFAWQGFGPAALAWSVLVLALSRAGLAMALRPVMPRVPRAIETLKPILNFSSASFIISASGAIGQRSQDLIVGRLLGLASTGLFSRAGALAAQLSTLIAGGLSSVFYSAFARKRDAGEPLAEPYLHLIACNTALNWAAMLGLALAAEPLVLLLYGERWADVAPLLQWMAIAEMLFVAIPLQMDIPILLGRIRTLIWINLLDTAWSMVRCGG
jgi:O-antigen/teichoic acid export membrane protein